MRRLLLIACLAMTVTITASVAQAYQHSVLGSEPLSDHALDIIAGLFLVIFFGGGIASS